MSTQLPYDSGLTVCRGCNTLDEFCICPSPVEERAPTLREDAITVAASLERVWCTDEVRAAISRILARRK